MTTVVEMEVPMDCPGCENKVRKALEKITGVRDVHIDMKQQRVTVTGSADEKKVLKVARNVTGRDVCLWSCPYHPESNAYHDRYLKKKFRNRINMSENGEKVSSYNYHKHGYHGHDHGYHQERPYSGLIDENASSMFSEENPHFCSIM
ncbi:PREDICTED: heavy metal-associated isoprenylated plant protein 21-like isoform X2 [Camelina sativa]|uniref:Heavy metal-associated isoprenylated plant protein 21-like isoform X1 n=1 Tax=Camelina sativa TaxID=90675 RepID=A0ABM0WZ62_CAMSA|nr:PREDICTED: heavy metal-associated isoprenylated plant protein 21-like isoform X1 [Camelina sativa]XP_010478270.1 PREDICTED: heavy metal-associated isoprenylated plant protein 21-like isoform X2 [Camelina sativa]